MCLNQTHQEVIMLLFLLLGCGAPDQELGAIEAAPEPVPAAAPAPEPEPAPEPAAAAFPAPAIDGAPSPELSAQVSTAFENRYAVTCWLTPIHHFNAENPCVLEDDFDGDGKPDAAVLVADSSTKKHGVVILRSNGEASVIGAGHATGNGGDDFKWMDIWRANPLPESAKVDGPRPALGLHLEKSESASGLVYWNGEAFVWLQQGD